MVLVAFVVGVDAGVGGAGVADAAVEAGNSAVEEADVALAVADVAKDVDGVQWAAVEVAEAVLAAEGDGTAAAAVELVVAAAVLVEPFAPAAFVSSSFQYCERVAGGVALA